MKAYLIVYENDDEVTHYQITRDEELAKALNKTYRVKRENGSLWVLNVEEIELEEN